ncbi:MAG TPA: outer membrane lipoprotein-sorting protein [Chthoniobacterales bacterium]|jgi:hypothetical protein
MTHLLAKQARKTALAVFSLTLFLCAAAAFSAKPSGPEILTQAREMIRAQDISITGKLRTGPNNVPFQLDQSGGVSTYTFRDPEETVTVNLGESSVKLSGVAKGAGASLIRGSVLSYDDLALRFLYWKRVEDLGQEKLRSLPCWKLRLDAPDKSSPYAFVKLWVNEQSGAFIRAQAFDWKGVLAKQFDVISTQKIGGRYFLKQMKIQLMQSTAKDAPTLSYLEIDKPR